LLFLYVWKICAFFKRIFKKLLLIADGRDSVCLPQRGKVDCEARRMRCFFGFLQTDGILQNFFINYSSTASGPPSLTREG
jgi:hypothetical protein